MQRQLLLEIGTEEIPAASIPAAMTKIEELLRRGFEDRKIRYDVVRTLATPRRLVAVVSELMEKADDTLQGKIGPSASSAKDDKGNPTAAALGFARSQGVDISSLETITTPRGDYLCVRKKIPGPQTALILPEIITGVITALSFRKSMRWGTNEFRFVRPIRWLLALYNGQPLIFQVANITSNNISCGHSFHSPDTFTVSGYKDYLDKTRQRHCLVDPEERKRIIVEEARKSARALGGEVFLDDGLLDTVTFLVEFPTVVAGTFEPDYLSLPKELLMTTMMQHQKYFPLMDEGGGLLPYFITVTNTRARDMAVVAKGNERVLRARLADARFFFEEDKKIRLEDRLDSLRQVMFHSKLGTSYEKVMRFTKVASWLAQMLAPTLLEVIERTSRLVKADLTTQMVAEFPELQGIMGREYALADGEPPEVAVAIYEHYLPIVSGGELPASDLGAIISIADKIDTITGFFSINLTPTGTTDPYALRRQALGIINIVLDKGYILSLSVLIDKALFELGDRIDRPLSEIREEVLEFFRSRFINLLISQGYKQDIVEAVLLGHPLNCLVSTRKKVVALAEFRFHPRFGELVAAIKRIENIIKGQSEKEQIDRNLFVEEEERILYDACCEAPENSTLQSNVEQYYENLVGLLALAVPINDFFAKVMVMTGEEHIRSNRIALLQAVARQIRTLADFSRLQGEQGQTD